MLTARRPRTAALLTLVLYTVASWHIMLPFLGHESCALDTASVDSYPKQVRGVNATASGSKLTDKTPVHPDDQFMGEPVVEATVGRRESSSYRAVGTVNPKSMRQIAEDAYHFVMNMPLYTANALMVHPLKTIKDQEIIALVDESKYFGVELYPILEGNKHLIEEGHCLVEFSIPFMGDHSGVACMVCLNPAIAAVSDEGNTSFVAKFLVKNPPTGGGTLVNHETIIEIPTHRWDGTSEGCLKFDYQKVYNDLFNAVDEYVYNKLGSYRLIYMNDTIYSLKEEARKKFVARFYDYVMPNICKGDKGLIESIAGHSKAYEEFKKNFATKSVKACPSNVRTADYKNSLLGKDELAALRAFDIYGQTGLESLLVDGESNIVSTRGECMFDELAHNGDLSAEYRLSTGHYIRIEYFKGPDKEGLIPDKLLYISIDVFGSVNVILFVGILPDANITAEHGDYVRAVLNKSQPCYSDITYIIKAKNVVNVKYNPTTFGLTEICLSGYQLICRGYFDKSMTGPEEIDDHVEKVYANIFELTELDKHFRNEEDGGNFYKHVDEAALQKSVTSDYSKVKGLRKDFLRKAISSINCQDFSAYESLRHMAPLPYDPEYAKKGPELTNHNG